MKKKFLKLLLVCMLFISIDTLASSTSGSAEFAEVGQGDSAFEFGIRHDSDNKKNITFIFILNEYIIQYKIEDNEISFNTWNITGTPITFGELSAQKKFSFSIEDQIDLKIENKENEILFKMNYKDSIYNFIYNKNSKNAHFIL